jgi:low affinity Fe/Cu permease
MVDDHEHRFSKIETNTANLSGHPWVFGWAAVFVCGRLLTGPLFHFSDPWQVVMNYHQQHLDVF